MAEVTGNPGPEAEDPALLPEDYLCANCDYPSGRSGSVVCPECGWKATSGELATRRHRLETIRAWQEHSRRRTQARWGLLLVAYALGLGIVSRDAEAMIIAGLAAGVWMPLSWVVGDLLSLGLGRSERGGYLRVLWERSLWVLHLPWLVFPLFVTVALFVGLIDRWAGGGDGAYMVTVVFGFAAWCLGSLIAGIVWWGQRLRGLHEGGYARLRARDGLAFIAGLVVIGGAIAMGFMAGTLTALGIADWVGLSV